MTNQLRCKNQLNLGVNLRRLKWSSPYTVTELLFLCQQNIVFILMDHPVQIGSISHNICFSKIQLSCRVEQAPQWPLCVTTNPALVAAASLLKLRKLYLRRSEGIVGINKGLRSSSYMSQLQSAYIGCNTGNREKLSSSQAQLGQATCLAVA